MPHGLWLLNASPSVDVPREPFRIADPWWSTNTSSPGERNREVRLRHAGAAGARWGELAAVPPAIEVADTTGTGDCFAGGP